MKYLTLVPAYGRDYKSAKLVKADFEANKDFNIASYGHPYDGKPVNIQQLISDAPITLNIRYKGLAQIAQVVLK